MKAPSPGSRIYEIATAKGFSPGEAVPGGD